MITRTLLLGGLAVGLGLAAGCKKKDDKAAEATKPVTPPGAPGAPAAGGAPAATDPAGTAAVGTAAGAEVGDLPPISDCPKSLAGNEKVARTIKKECGPIVVSAPYGVDGTLTLEAGVVLKFKDGASLDVGYYGPAKLIVKGTAKEPVVFTSGGDQAPGVWQGVRLYEQADRSSIEGLQIEWAGDSDKGALYIEAQDVVVKGSSIKNAKEVGLRGGDKASFAEFTGNSFEKYGKIALSVAPITVGTLGAGNTFPADAFVEVRGGAVDASTRWVPVGAPYHFIEDVNIDGKNGRATVEIVAGTDLRFASGAELAVGYYSQGGLKVSGTKDKPVSFTGIEKKPDGWTGLRIYDSGEATVEYAVFESGGAENDKGALALGRSSLTVSNSIFRGNQLGLSVDKEAKKLSADNLSFEGNGLAVLITAEQLDGLGAANKYGDKQTIEVRGGTARKEATWNLQPGAQILVSEDMAVDKATIRVAPGTTFAFKEGVEWSVGYYEEATLKLNGTADKPIVLRGVRDEKESWDGMKIYSNAREVVLEHVQLVNVAGEAGIKVQRGKVKLSKVSCSGCAAVATWDCESKLEQADVTGKMIKPTCQ